MNGFSILMFIFGLGIFLAGLYLYTGHKNEVLLWKVHDIKKMPMKEVKNVGRITMISSLVPIIIGIIGLFLDI